MTDRYSAYTRLRFDRPHPRVLRDAFHLRLGGSRRLQEADLHNRLGIWALPFHFTLALTGALCALFFLITIVRMSAGH